MPQGSYVGVRMGDVLKQGRYEPSRCYRFPKADRRKNAKIDVYQHIGSCTLAVEPDAKALHEVKVECSDPAFTGMRLKVNVHSKNDEVGRQQREARASALRGQAKDYLVQHSIEERLSEAVKLLLQDQPADPIKFLCTRLEGDGNVVKDAKPVPDTKESSQLRKEEPLETAALSKSLEQAVEQAVVEESRGAGGYMVPVMSQLGPGWMGFGCSPGFMMI